MKEKLKNSKGITLIALVITIILILVIAVIVISITVGNNGLVNRTIEAKKVYNEATAREYGEMLLTEWRIENKLTGKTLSSFLTERGIDFDDEVDSFVLHLNGYLLTVDENGEILEVEDALNPTPKPRILDGSIALKSQSGAEIEDNSIQVGTPVKISFNVSFEEGEILSVEPNTTFNTETGEVTYLTNGTEMEVLFTITGSNGKTIKKKISVANKYEIIIQADSLLDAIKDNTFETLEDGQVSKIGINGKTESYGVRVYNVNGDLTVSDTREYGTAQDVATASNYAKNMVVLKVNGDLNITSTGKITAYHDTNYGGPKGMLIYVTGNLTNEGEISMTARGAKASGQNVYLFKNADDTYEFIPANSGQGTARLPGRGGNGDNMNESGGGRWRPAGGTATSYSGGVGGWTVNGNTNGWTNVNITSSDGGEGGHFEALWSNDRYRLNPDNGVGAGNPYGGTGGTLVLFADNISSFGTISSCGSTSPNRIRRRIRRWIY